MASPRHGIPRVALPDTELHQEVVRRMVSAEHGAIGTIPRVVIPILDPPDNPLSSGDPHGKPGTAASDHRAQGEVRVLRDFWFGFRLTDLRPASLSPAHHRVFDASRIRSQ